MADKERTRVMNFLKKEIEIDFENIREVAEAYKHLSEIEELIKTEKRKLESTLIENEVDERFDDGMKVQFQEGRKQTSIDVESVFNELGADEFLKIAKVSSTDLKKAPNGNILLAKYQKDLGTKTKPSIKCSKMNKEELKEYEKRNG